MTSGFGGCGAYSDGKFNMGTAYGGTLGEELGEELTMEYINLLDSILAKYATDYPAMYESLKNEGLEEMKGITWEKAGQKVIDIYNQVIKK